ncbi:uncharacterized protein K444DRAFT_520202, partial [Hyaloscypha bicolor E]
LSGLKLSQDIKTTLDENNKIPLIQKYLAEIIIILPGITIKEEFRRRNMAINIVTAYYYF